jgi:hypothetical protein
MWNLIDGCMSLRLEIIAHQPVFDKLFCEGTRYPSRLVCSYLCDDCAVARDRYIERCWVYPPGNS